MFINTTPVVQIQQFKQILGGVHQELFKLLESRGLTGELPENGPKGLKAKSMNGLQMTANDCDCAGGWDCFCD